MDSNRLFKRHYIQVDPNGHKCKNGFCKIVRRNLAILLHRHWRLRRETVANVNGNAHSACHVAVMVALVWGRHGHAAITFA